MEPLELMGLRFLIALPVLFVILKSRRIALKFNGYKKKLLIGSVIIGVHFFIQITGVKYTTATNTGWIISVTPLVMALLAFLILKERIKRNAIFAIVIATFGILLLMSGGEFGSLGWLSSIGDWLVLASAHTWALYTIVTRDLSRKLNPLSVTFAVQFPAALVVLGIMLFSSDWNSFLNLPLEATLSLLFLGLMALALAHWFWQEGVARAGAAEAGIFLYLEPVATTALAVPLLGESFTIYTAAGGLIVLFAVWLSQR